MGTLTKNTMAAGGAAIALIGQLPDLDSITKAGATGVGLFLLAYVIIKILPNEREAAQKHTEKVIGSVNNQHRDDMKQLTEAIGKLTIVVSHCQSVQAIQAATKES